MVKKDAEPTPVHDELRNATTESSVPDPSKAAPPVEVAPDQPQNLDYLNDVASEDVTTFEEDDDPTSLAGDFVDEDGDGVDDRKGKN